MFRALTCPSSGGKIPKTESKYTPSSESYRRIVIRR